MAKRTKLWVAGALLLAVSGAAVASNMGFKFVPNLNQTNKTFTISLPLNQNYANASAVFNDIQASGCTAAKVERMVPSAGGALRQTWTSVGGINFSIAKGEGYIVEVGATCTNWVVVGSHDPAFVYNFSQTGKSYLTSIPYHTTATTASDVFASIPSASKVERIVPSSGGALRQTWTSVGGTNFAVGIGEAYIVEVSAASSWTPAHY